MDTVIADSPLITGLLDNRAYRHETGTIELLETHISWILLTGEFAYKIKKPVDFGFLDFSTLEKRRFCCEEELRLNRRFSASSYLGVVSITGTPEHPSMDGTGAAIEYAVKMRQFDQHGLLSERSEQGLLSTDEIDGIAQITACFHRNAAVAAEDTPYGEPDDIKHWNDENFQHIEPLLTGTVEIQRIERLKTWARDEWRDKCETMQQRKRQGFVRECHGDLHLGNIALIGGDVTPFDCIEFNPKLRWIDVASEMAFIFMDLTYRKHDAFAWRLLNGYLQRTGDYQGLSLLRYYLVYRSLVRAKVALLRMQQDNDAANRLRIQAEYTAFADLAERYTQSSRPLLLLTHGFSGSGKSFYARNLAESLGAVHLRSDIERKRLFGFKAQTQTESSAGTGIYSAEAGRLTYRYLADSARNILTEGFNVIVDATFLKREQREAFQNVADDTHARLTILDIHAGEQVLAQRIESRRQRCDDPSEATLEILQLQIETAEPLTEKERARTLSVDTASKNVLPELLRAIRAFKPGES